MTTNVLIWKHNTHNANNIFSLFFFCLMSSLSIDTAPARTTKSSRSIVSIIGPEDDSKTLGLTKSPSFKSHVPKSPHSSASPLGRSSAKAFSFNVNPQEANVFSFVTAPLENPFLQVPAVLLSPSGSTKSLGSALLSPKGASVQQDPKSPNLDALNPPLVLEHVLDPNYYKHLKDIAATQNVNRGNRQKSISVPIATPDKIKKLDKEPLSKRIGKFYFPIGTAPPASPTTRKNKATRVEDAFRDYPRGIPPAELHKFVKEVLQLPSYLSGSVYLQIRRRNEPHIKDDQQLSHLPSISKFQFIDYWKAELENHDSHSQLFQILRSPFKTYLTRQNFVHLVQEVVDGHPGLEFLERTPEFQVRYRIALFCNC